MFVSSAEDDENKNQGGIDIKTQSNKTELIIKYHNLFKEGIISEEEFEKKKGTTLKALTLKAISEDAKRDFNSLFSI